MRSKIFNTLILFLWLSNLNSLAQKFDSTLNKETINSHTYFEKITIHSEVLNEERKLWISLPKNYDANSQAYPILYVLDAQSHFKTTLNVIDYLSSTNKIPQLILVGIPLIESDNLVRDRIRDYSPTHVEVTVEEQGSTPWQKSGNAHVFRQFIAKEAIPLIEKEYRTLPFRILAGHSQGGLFAISSLLSSNSDLFNAYISASPALWWDDGVIVKQAQTSLNNQFNHHFYISLADGDKNLHHQYTPSFVKILQFEQPNGLDWKFDFIQNESHASTVLKSYYNGLAHIYRNWALPAYRLEAGVAGIKAHFSQLSQTYGYQIQPTERMINQLGYQQIWAGQRKQAIELFTYNTKLYPKSANAFDSLAEGYMQDNQNEKAIINYKKSLALDPGNKNAEKMLTKLNKHP